MELTIVPLQQIYGHDDPKPKSPNPLPPSDLTPPQPIPTVHDDVYNNYSPEEPDKRDDATVDLAEIDDRLEAYTVRVDGHRILTLFTYNSQVSTKWVREIRRCYRKGERIIVGMSVDRQIRYDKKGVKTSINQIMQLCVGSQCLIVELPEYYDYPDVELPLIPFFDDPRVVAAGCDMKNVAEKLLKDHKIKIRNVMELSEVAEEVLENSHQLDLRRYDLDKLATTVMGRSWYVDRPEKVKWFEDNQYWGQLTLDKLKYATYDAYLCFSMGVKLLEMKREREREKKGAGSAGKKGNSKKKKGTNDI